MTPPRIAVARVAVGVMIMFTSVACAQTASTTGTFRYREATKTTTYGGGLAGERVTDSGWARSVRAAKRASVLVTNHGCHFVATGSGVVVGNSQVVTNRHVVHGASKLNVKLPSGKHVSVARWSVSTSEDLALLELRSPVSVAPIQVSPEESTPGDLVTVVGYPLGGPRTIGRGRIIDALEPTKPGTSSILEASVDVLPGNSGGPLMATDGQLAGVVRAIDLQTGSALAVPSSAVRALISGESSRRAHACTD